MEDNELKELLQKVSAVLEPKEVPLAPKWREGTLTLEPGIEGQSKEIPIDVFFKKLLTVRDSLRVLEQKINNHKNLLPEEKINMQGYITKAYGTLTSFNILFSGSSGKFVGSKSGQKSEDKETMSIEEAKKKLGLNEY